jgi:GNAT superfamily N-acetyltransferase
MDMHRIIPGAAQTETRRRLAAASDEGRARPARAGGPVVLLRGSSADLGAANRVIEAAVMTWDLPERVKRLSLPSYLYDAQDLAHLDLVLADVLDAGVVGVAAWEPADPPDSPAGQRALLLHGLYVLPESQRGGIGRELLGAAERAAARQGYDGLLVKAQPSSAGFFATCGYRPLAVQDPGRDYPHRFWKPLFRERMETVIEGAYDSDQQ